MKKLIPIIAIITTLIACTKYEEVEDYTPPTISLDSCITNSSNSFTAYISIDKGESFFNHKIQILLYDVEDVSKEAKCIDVTLGEDRKQKLQQSVIVPNPGHNYIVCALMKTDKNSFKSESTLVTTVENSVSRFLHLYGVPYYFDSEGIYETEDVKFHIEKDSCIYIRFKKAIQSTTPVQIRVGNKIIDGINLDGTNLIRVDLKGIEPGTYDVALHLTDAEYPLEKKICILPWTLHEEKTCSMEEFEYLPYAVDNTFRCGDKIYYCMLNSEWKRIVSYDLNTKQWTKLKDIPYDFLDITVYNNKAYATTNTYFSIDNQDEVDYLIEYDPETDSWKSLSPIPVKNVYTERIFAAAGSIYIYVRNDLNIDKYDLWKYDLAKKKWSKTGNVPINQYILGAVNGENKIYAMTAQGNLWIYDVKNDKWQKETQLLPQYDMLNNKICLILHDGKLYYISDGGAFSIYCYDFSNKNWEMLALHEFRTEGGRQLSATFHENRLIIGPVRAGFDIITEYLYFLNTDIK